MSARGRVCDRRPYDTHGGTASFCSVFSGTVIIALGANFGPGGALCTERVFTISSPLGVADSPLLRTLSSTLQPGAVVSFAPRASMQLGREVVPAS
jgi:hypothetical protein